MLAINAAARIAARQQVLPFAAAAIQSNRSSTLRVPGATPFQTPANGIWIPAEGIILTGFAVLSAYSKHAIALQALQPPPDPHAEALFGKAFGIATTLTGIAALVSDSADAEKCLQSTHHSALAVISTDARESIGHNALEYGRIETESHK